MTQQRRRRRERENIDKETETDAETRDGDDDDGAKKLTKRAIINTKTRTGGCRINAVDRL